MTYNAGILIVSDRAARGEYEDKSGPVIREQLEGAGFHVAVSVIVPDEHDQITGNLIRMCDNNSLSLVITSGGTGYAPRDVTPEATRSVVQRELTSISAGLLVESLKITPFAMLSRYFCGVRGATVIVNVPGSPKAAKECVDIILPILPHALEVLAGTADVHPSKP